MGFARRVLLIEHLDATGAAPADARQHAAALRAAGVGVEALILDGGGASDLLFPPHSHHAEAGFDVLGRDAHSTIAPRVRASRADLVLWASATPGGGEAARALDGSPNAYWWPTGHAPAAAGGGPLPALDPALAPMLGSALADEALARRRLSLWDGPFVLVPAAPSARAAAALLDAFARAAEDADEVDLVVLAHPDAGFENLARRAGVAQRVHFVGPAPREAEHAWLGTAVVALVAGDSPVSGGLVLRALASGCPVLTLGEAAAPLTRWLQANGLRWDSAGDASPHAGLAAALRREPAVLEARERGRTVARAHDLPALGARLAAALRQAGGAARKAA